MQQLEMKRTEGHILMVLSGRNYIIDTGSPLSFAFDGPETICLDGKDYALQAGMIGVDRRAIEALVREPIAGFIGLDTLTELGTITFLVKEGALRVGGRVTGTVVTEAELGCNGMYISLAADIGGREAELLLDTGARIDYIDAEYLNHDAECRHESDYNPQLGDMEVDGYAADCRIGGKTYSTFLYEQPGGLGMMLSLLGINGIIGLNMFFEAGENVTIDLENDRLIVSANELWGSAD